MLRALLLILALAPGVRAAGAAGEEVIMELRSRHAAVPGDAETTHALARALAGAGEYAEAEALYAELVQTWPDNADYLLGLGQVLLWSGRATAAIPRLEQARDAAPEYADIYPALARAYDETGQVELAATTRRLAAERFGTPAVATPHTGPRTYGFLTHRLVLLSDNPEDWHDTHFEIGYSPRKHVSLGAFAVDSERFGLDDKTWGVNGNYPLFEHTQLYGELSFSPEHEVLPASNAYLQVSRELGAGFGILAGVRRVEYTESLVHIGDFTLERYFGSFRAAYTAYPAHSDSAGDTLSHRVQLSHYMDGGSQISASFSTGSEVDKPFDARSVIETDIDSVSLWGKVRLTPALGLSWSADYSDLGVPGRPDSKRKGFNLGLEYDF